MTAARWFAWSPNRHTALALSAGAVSIALSLLLVPLAGRPVWAAWVRDVGQIVLVGVALPVWFVLRNGESAAEFGFHGRRWRPFLAINLALAVALLLLLMRVHPVPADFAWSSDNLWRAGYVAMALVFELVFFYGFMRTLFERAFGVVPGIVLAAGFYALHHAGFQPEFSKLFWVGVLYATTMRLGHSVLLIFPFFLGVGGIYDVLLQSKVVAPIAYPEWRTILLALVLTGAAAWYARRSTAARQPARAAAGRSALW